MPELPSNQLSLDFAPPELLTVEEIWFSATSALLKQISEDRRVERKPAGIHAKELAQYLSMWANTSDGGLIAIGIENNGAISGCMNAETSHLNALDTHSRDMCPDAKVDARFVHATNIKGQSDNILLFRVHYNPKKVVKTTSGEAFIRYGESKHKLKPEEIKELEIDKGQLEIEQEPCPTFVFPEDFREDLLNDFAESVRVRHEMSSALSTAEILELRRLGKRHAGKFIANTAAVLVFAKDPLTVFPGCKIRFLRFEGETEGTGDKWNAVKDVPIEGPIPHLIREAERVVESQLRDFSRLGNDGKFYTAPEYPKDAWIEAVVNACVHRSYGEFKNMPTFIRMFDDRLEMESPGGFKPPVTPENIYDIHATRNPVIMDTMLYLKYVKAAREGTRRMRNSMLSADLPLPAFQQKELSYSVVKVTLRNNVKQRKAWVDADATEIIGEDLAMSLNEEERSAVNWIAANGGTANCTQISRQVGRDWQTTQKMLLRLVGRGVLRHVHRDDILRDPKAHFVLAPRVGKGKRSS
jgi:ATP-dependent DNA helicase RecG